MKRPVPDRLLTLFSWGSALVLFTGFFIIMGFLLIKGWGSLGQELIFATTLPWDALTLKHQVFGGLFPAMIGTFLLVILAIIFSLPLGLASGIYLAEYAQGPLKRFFGFLFDLLAGIPSVLVGLFGFSITIFLHHGFGSRIYPCLLISAFSLAFLVLPYIITSTQNAFESLPLALRLTGPSLGANKFQTIVFVLLPAALSDIISGIVLAIGRCAEDTAVIMFTGVVAAAGIPDSVFSSFEALPFYIYYIASEYSGPQELATGYGAAIILLFICAGLFFLAHGLKHWINRKTGYRAS